MKTSVRVATFLAAGPFLLLGGGLPALAGSTMTEAFVANVHPNVDFLDNSSRLAIDASSNPKVRAFARSEVTEQTITANSLVAWTATNTRVYTDNVATGVDDVLTGRSVAIDSPLPPLTVTPATTARTAAPDVLLPAGEADMATLSKLRGRRFDAFFLTTQTDALRQLVTLYSDYARDGDDPALRAIAIRELPKVQHRLAEVRSL